MVYDYVIVGAGLSGALISYHFTEKGIRHLIVDKGRGAGGRFSSRRLEKNTFNHGSQKIPFHEFEYEKWFQKWFLHDWIRERSSHWSIETNSSQLIKSLIDSKNLILNEQILNLKKEEDHVVLNSASEKSYIGKKVILTAPLPQSTELASFWLQGHPLQEKIQKSVYSKKIIFFIENKRLIRFAASNEFLIESKQTDHMVVFSDTISAYCFDMPEDKIIQVLSRHLASFIEDLKPTDIHLKKWRFSEPVVSLEESHFKSVDKKVFITGDAFCGQEKPSIEKAIESVHKLLIDSDLLS